MQEEDIVGQIAQTVAANPPKTEEGKSLLNKVVSAEQTVKVNQSSLYYNLVESLDPQKASQIGKEIKQGYTDDDKTRSDWLDMHEFWLRLYMQTDSAQNSDSERSWGATESLPILTEACDQFQSRTYKTFFPTKTFVSAIPIAHTLDPQKRKMLKDKADRIGRHMSWQLGIKNKNYCKDKRALFLGVAIHGSFFTKTYYDTIKNRAVVDNVRPTDLVIDHAVGQRRIEDIRRKSHIIYTTLGETQILANKGFFIAPGQPDEAGKQTSYNQAVAESNGIIQGNATIKQNKPVTLIEQQFYLDIDDSNNFLPYIGTIDLASGKLLRLTIDYEADPRGTPLKDYEQLQYYTHYKFSENPDGFYGLGLGHKIGDINSAINIGIRQMLDAATLANDGNNSGYISERLCLDNEEEVSLTLGKLKKIPDTTGDLQAGIMMMKFPGPSEALGSLIDRLDQRAQRIATTTEATTGSIEKNQQPTTVLAQIEQAMELFSSVQMGLADSLGDELDKVYRLNQKHLPLVEYFTVNDSPEQITRLDYADDMSVEPVFDPKFATQQQKMARAQTVIQMTLQNPVNQTRPQVIDAAFKRAYEAMDEDNIEELIPTQPPPVSIDDQVKENMLFLMPPGQKPPFDVFPEHNHAEHLAEMEPFVAQYGAKLLPEQQQEVIAHKMKHEAMLYGQQMGIIPNEQANPANSPGISGMASKPGYEVGIGPMHQGFPAPATAN